MLHGRLPEQASSLGCCRNTAGQTFAGEDCKALQMFQATACGTSMGDVMAWRSCSSAQQSWHRHGANSTAGSAWLIEATPLPIAQGMYSSRHGD